MKDLEPCQTRVGTWNILSLTRVPSLFPVPVPIPSRSPFFHLDSPWGDTFCYPLPHTWHPRLLPAGDRFLSSQDSPPPPSQLPPLSPRPNSVPHLLLWKVPVPQTQQGWRWGLSRPRSRFLPITITWESHEGKRPHCFPFTQ